MGACRGNSRAPESKARASYSSSIHLSRVLSRVTSVLIPSVLVVRVVEPLDMLPGVETVGVVGVATEFFRLGAASKAKSQIYKQRQSNTENGGNQHITGASVIIGR